MCLNQVHFSIPFFLNKEKIVSPDPNSHDINSDMMQIEQIEDEEMDLLARIEKLEQNIKSLFL